MNFLWIEQWFPITKFNKIVTKGTLYEHTSTMFFSCFEGNYVVIESAFDILKKKLFNW